MPSVEQHKAVLDKLMRDNFEEFYAEVCSWAERAEADGRDAAARQHREHLARLDAMIKPWETLKSE